LPQAEVESLLGRWSRSSGVMRGRTLAIVRPRLDGNVR